MRNLTLYATPEFLSWFDEGSRFIPNFLNHVYANWPAHLPESHIPTDSDSMADFVRTKIAIVDRIPFPNGASSGCPGFSLALTKVGRKFMVESKSSDINPAVSSNLVGKIRRKLHCNHSRSLWASHTLTLETSNTMFSNGRRSTQFVETWSQSLESANSTGFVSHGDRFHSAVLPSVASDSQLSIRLPLQRLTEKREIANCMGNIISKLMASSSDGLISQPASLELEKKVTALISEVKEVGTALTIFALIYPRTNAQANSGIIPERLPDFAGQRRLTPEDIETPSPFPSPESIGLAILSGARLHRVTSGGGGWGNKQGLLSLEPATHIAASRDALDDSVTALDGENTFSVKSLVHNIAQPGDSVEFYAALTSEESDSTLVHKYCAPNAFAPKNSNLELEGSNIGVVNFVFGTIPPQTPSTSNASSFLGSAPIVFHDHFGMLSEKGILFRSDRNGNHDSKGSEHLTKESSVNITRLDAPYTVIRYISRKMERRPTKTAGTGGRLLRSPPKKGAARKQSRPPAL